MKRTFNELLEYVDALGIDLQPEQDVKKFEPELSIDDAYRLQFAMMERRVARGDEIVGYKASAVRPAAAKQRPGVPVPTIGTILRSQLRQSDDTVELDSAIKVNNIEPEIIILLKRDLIGPNVRSMDVLGAVEAFIPSFETAPLKAGFAENKWSHHQLCATAKTGGTIVVGHQMTSPNGIDIRLEGVVGSIDGTIFGSATAIEVMGSPLNVVAAIANKLSQFEIGLRAGMIVQTGSIIDPMRTPPGAREALAEFTRIGSVRVRFAD